MVMVRARRKGAGRKPSKEGRRNVPHRKRPRLDGKNHPVHVTQRAPVALRTTLAPKSAA
jgi:hypothetical protein